MTNQPTDVAAYRDAQHVTKNIYVPHQESNYLPIFLLSISWILFFQQIIHGFKIKGCPQHQTQHQIQHQNDQDFSDGGNFASSYIITDFHLLLQAGTVTSCPGSSQPGYGMCGRKRRDVFLEDCVLECKQEQEVQYFPDIRDQSKKKNYHIQ